MRRNIKRKLIATICAVTMIVGNMSVSAYADDTALKITKQPTEANPTVTVNKDDATYQWYKASEDDKYTVADIAGTIVGDKIIAATGNSGDMNCEVDGVWTGYNVSAYVGVEVGDIIKVTQLGDYENAPCFPEEGITLEDDGTGVYTYTATSSFVCQLCIAIEDANVSGKIEIVRDGVTYPVVNGMDEVVDGRIAGRPQSNTTFSDGLWYSYSTGRLCVDVYLEEGQTLKVTGNEDCYADMECWALMGMSGATVSGIDNVYTYRVETDGIYRIDIDNGISFNAKVEVINLTRGQAVAGQTTNTLTSIEEGEVYSCLVTCGEEEVWSEYIVAEMAIVKQPTSMEPTVKVNYPDEVESYQWYGTSDVVLDLIYDDDAATDGEIEADNVWTGEYFDGIWHSESGLIDVAVVANKGDKVIITLPDDFDGVVYDYDTGEEFVYSNGVYEYVIDSDNGYLDFAIESDTDFTAEIQVKTYGIGDAIEGETTATLENYEFGETYVCKIVSKEDTELLSKYISMVVEIITQPTAGNPTVGVNFPDEVSGYQWYGVDAELLTVVEGEAAEDEIEIYRMWDGEYFDEIWHSEDGLIDVAVVANRGDKVIITLPDDFDGVVYDYDTEEEFVYTNGVYEYVIDWANGYLNFVIESDTDFTAEIQVETFTLGEAITTEKTATLNNGELGKKYICEVTCEDGDILWSDYVTMDIDIASQPIATNPTVEVNFPDEVAGYQWYVAEYENYEVVDESAANSSDVIGAEAEDGTYEDGVWTAEAFNTNGYFDIIVIFEVTAGYTIKIVPSTDAIEDVMCQSQAGSEKLKCEDGVYYFEVETSGEYAVGLLSLEEFTAEITVEKMAKGEAVEGQTTNRLTNHEAGDYICEVTLSDGTVLESDLVSIAEADITHTYTDEYDADCNDCGATREVPERDTETESNDSGSGAGTGSGDTDADSNGSGTLSPDTGDDSNVVVLLMMACAGAIGVLVVAVSKKRRYQ